MGRRTQGAETGSTLSKGCGTSSRCVPDSRGRAFDLPHDGLGHCGESKEQEIELPVVSSVNLGLGAGPRDISHVDYSPQTRRASANTLAACWGAFSGRRREGRPVARATCVSGGRGPHLCFTARERQKVPDSPNAVSALRSDEGVAGSRDWSLGATSQATVLGRARCG